MKLKTEKIVVVDLEATCWERDTDFQRKTSEIIEIGICNLHSKTGEITDKRSIYIKPIKAEISTFCTKLTGITPELVEEKGIGFIEAMDLLDKEYKATGFVWASYGAYDFNQLEKQCKEYGIKNPLGTSHLNVKNLIAFKLKLENAVGMDRALKLINEPLEGSHHCGADDAYNTAKLLRYIFA